MTETDERECLADWPEPRNITEALTVLTKALAWLDNNDMAFPAIYVNHAIERLESHKGATD